MPPECSASGLACHTVLVKRTVLVVGASRGIGLELARQYAADGWRVHATTRTPHRPGELGELSVELHGLDVQNADERSALAADLAPAGVEVVIHNAGVGQGTPRSEMMAVNAEGPILTVEALFDAGAIDEDGRVVLVTSQLGARRGRKGSLGDYGDSKAALNDEFRRRAPAWGRRGVVAVVVHPGWVRTDMGGRAAPLSVQESAAGIRNLIESLTGEHHGRFWTWDGREHPW